MIYIGKAVIVVFASTKLGIKLCQASSMQLVSKITLATFDFNKHLTMK